jgi:transposase
MRPLTIPGTTAVLSLQQEIQRSEESRYDHRLHGVLLVAQGMTCPEVARLLGDAPRSVENWVHRFDQEGLAGLTEGERSGRPSRLDAKQAKRDQSGVAGQAERRGYAGKSLGRQDAVSLD